MSSHHRVSRLLRGLLLAAALLVLALWLAWRALLAAQGISTLDWQGLRLSGEGLRLEQLRLQSAAADGSRLQLQASGLQLAWPARAAHGFFLPALRSQDLQINWLPGQAAGGAAPQVLPESLGWLPRQLEVEQLSLDLPCVRGRCVLRGNLLLKHAGELQQPAELLVQLQEAGHSLRLQAGLAQNQGQWQLLAELLFDQQSLLKLDSQIRTEAALRHWSGALELQPLSDSRALLAWLQQWQSTDQRLIDAQAVLRLQAGWQLALAPGEAPLALQHLRGATGTLNAALQLQSPLLQQGDLRLEQVQLELKLDGQLAADNVQVRLGPSSSLRAGRYRVGPAVQGRQLRARLAGLNVQLANQPDARPRLTGPLQLSVASLEQADLLPQAWQFRGRLDAGAVQQQLQGVLSNAAGLRLQVDASRDAQAALHLSAELAEVFFHAGNPLSQTFRAWPALLQFSSGRLLGQARLRWPTAPQRLELDLGLQFKGLAGIYDRSELSGLDGRLQAQVRGDQLRLELPELSLEQLNPGVPIGPLQLQGSYAAALAQPRRGLLAWQTAQGGLFNGLAWLPPGQLDLAQSAQQLPLRFKDVQLEELFRVYPAEGLAGRGSLGGELPLRLDASGLHIDQGRLAAQAPGYLQFRSARIDALGRSNPATQVMVDALADFHFELLESTVSYDPSGKLSLALHLLGRNPDVEKGRPINLNVNLQEDIPALLTSLQLTDRVSETVRQRVQESLRPRPAP
ncbi:intermembrane phospholipid transport protein YdbH family protein [Pseudomonas sp. N040]|uniref:intermembrane phospholipid transport protein YdbH family protein n=1 Tax=Pseudomonas sp. N040 TaxID=2785325 RepID=UPI0018A33218|nr:YdbH domain-containing protein [Pseudomonas sp. N040]MBF7728712.1 YdbH domain-containing protein [Pseudomonas sp. N040]MBW7012352.1 YdbH domain-containing protein [Pseudomonas sp. N040]